MTEIHPAPLAVIEEDFVVTKRPVLTGKVTVRTETSTEEELLTTSLTIETVGISRVPINRDVSEMPQVRVEDGVTIIPVVEERLITRKQLVLVEEIRIERQDSLKDVSLPISLRKQRAIIERSGSTTPTPNDED